MSRRARPQRSQSTASIRSGQKNRQRGTLGHREVPTKKRLQEAGLHKPQARSKQEREKLGFWQWFKRLSVPVSWLKGLAVLPLAVASLVVMVTLLRLLRIQAQVEHVLSITSLRFFVLGAGVVLASLLIPLLHRPLRALYVLGHELSHALAVGICFGRVQELRWGSQGGYVVATRSNMLITLAPYLLPLWAMLWSVSLLLLHLIWEVPYFERILWFGLGVAICFHLLFTLWMSTMEQSDFRHNGLAFSLLLISLVNGLWLLTILVLVDPQIEWSNVLYVARDSAKKLFELFESLIRSLASATTSS